MLGILLAGLPGCGQSLNNKVTSSSESSASDEPESEIIYINGVLTESDEDSVTMEYGSEGNFTQTTFDITRIIFRGTTFSCTVRLSSDNNSLQAVSVKQ